MEHLERWLEQPDRALLSDAALRLARRVPAARAALDGLLETAVERALAGLGDVDPAGLDALDAARAVTALVDGGSAPEPAFAAELERRASGQAAAWVPAARAHVHASPARERAGRIALSEQDIPYVYPGDLHPLQVELLAVGDRVLPALHVDWVRKLTDLACDALLLDCQHLGLWLLPVLDALYENKLARELPRVARARKRAPGMLGIAALYLDRLGESPAALMRDAHAADRLLLDLDRAGRQRVA